MRPGRFDRRVPVELPDLQGREGILRKNVDKLHEPAKFLLEKETITGDEFMAILNAPPAAGKALCFTARPAPENDPQKTT